MPASDGLSVYVAIKFVSALVTPFKEWKAYKLGLINADGDKIRDPATDEERKQFTTWMNLIRNVKRLLVKVPGGQSKIASFAVAYALLKDSIEKEANSKITNEELFSILRHYGMGEMCRDSKWLKESNDQRYIISDPVLHEICPTAVKVVESDYTNDLVRVKGKRGTLVCKKEDLIRLD